MSSKYSVGEQLDSRSLYERQKKYRADHSNLPAPIIVAVQLQSPENMGSVLRLADAADSVQVIFVSNSDASHSLKQIQRAARHADT